MYERVYTFAYALIRVCVVYMCIENSVYIMHVCIYTRQWCGLKRSPFHTIVPLFLRYSQNHSKLAYIRQSPSPTPPPLSSYNNIIPYYNENVYKYGCVHIECRPEIRSIDRKRWLIDVSYVYNISMCNLHVVDSMTRPVMNAIGSLNRSEPITHALRKA